MWSISKSISTSTGHILRNYKNPRDIFCCFFSYDNCHTNAWNLKIWIWSSKKLTWCAGSWWDTASYHEYRRGTPRSRDLDPSWVGLDSDPLLETSDRIRIYRKTRIRPERCIEFTTINLLILIIKIFFKVFKKNRNAWNILIIFDLLKINILNFISGSKEPDVDLTEIEFKAIVYIESKL